MNIYEYIRRYMMSIYYVSKKKIVKYCKVSKCQSYKQGVKNDKIEKKKK